MLRRMSENTSSSAGSADAASAGPSITAAPNGPLIVEGNVPLYRRADVQSEHGEPLVWKTTEQVETRAKYALCRCGESGKKPFCDGTHAKVGFVADETAGGTYAERSHDLGGTGITVSDDRSICVHAGFCGTRVTNVWKQVNETDESITRAQVINAISNCPSGALTFQMEGEVVEPLLPQAVSVIDDGPIWVTGGIGITGSNGEAIETRNRVTLCRCGASANKPLCDGSHKEVGFVDPPHEPAGA